MNEASGLADFLCKGLEVVSVGINPSLHSVTAGFPFSSPRNRFWPAFNQSALIDYEIEPSPASMQQLLDRERMGFTDIVKRPTRGISELKAADYRRGAKELNKKLLLFRPAMVWFQGMTAARYFYQYVGAKPVTQPTWGLQDKSQFPFLVFVSPNPSPANAAFSFSDLVGYYNELAKLKRSGALDSRGAKP